MQRERVCAAILACVLFSAAAGADTVYMRDGRSYSGKVTVEGAKVLIDTGTGVVQVNLKEVIHISRKGAPKAATTKPKPSGPAAGPRAKVYSIEDVTSPEPVLFMLMRKLEGSAPGMDSYRIREQIKQLQIAAHDQKRKVGGKWVDGQYFATRRRNYEEILKDCRQLALKLHRMRTRTGRQKATRLAMKRQLGVKLREAARTWADPQIRLFLTGVAELRSEDFGRAERVFAQCAEQTPLVAAYHQGHGMSLMGLKRPTDALAAFVKMLQLRPESSLAVRLVTDAAKKVPGMNTKKRIYKEARAMLSEYRQSGSSRRGAGKGTKWLMPDKRPWDDPDDTLPIPTYDRLTFRRAVGVPIGMKTLLVDEAVMKDAIEVAVQIGPGTVVPGKIRRIIHYGKKESPAPLAMVSIDGYELTSVVGEIDTKVGRPKAEPKGKFTAGTDVTIYGLAFYAEMGGAVRKTGGRVKSVKAGGEIELAGSLLPGDAAGPVLTREGELAGFLTGRTDASSAGGGKSQFIEMAQIEPLIVRARRSSRAYSPLAGYDRAVRKITAKKMQGDAFVVYGIFSERY